MTEDRKTLEAIRDALVKFESVMDNVPLPGYTAGDWSRRNLDAMIKDVETWLYAMGAH